MIKPTEGDGFDLLSYKTAALILRLELLTNFYADSHTGAIESSGNKKKKRQNTSIQYITLENDKKKWPACKY